MAMIWTQWQDEGDLDPDEALRYREFAQQAGAAGVLAAGDALHPSAAATTVRVRDDAPQLVDGPFAETKEQLSGYFVLDCTDLDEALGWAARIPGARHGAVEIRPILEMEAMM
jgi:hypothetical protein